MTNTRVAQRPVNVAPSDTVVRHGDGGVIYMESPFPLGAYAVKLTERLERWAAEAPDRTYLAERVPSGDWRRVSYREALLAVRSLAQAIVDRRLSPERPIVILSGNSIDHALLALAAMYAGVLYAPVAPAYSLQAREFTTLQQIFARMEPGLVFAADGAPFERALTAVVPADCELVVSTSAPSSIPATRFSDLAATPATSAVDAAHARVSGDTIAKILFTSGSTGRPKGVINTQRMLCSNQQMLRSVFRFLADAPPVLCDWLPWNHTAGGNHNFGIVLYNGGTLYIDEGKPTPAMFGATVRNLREVPCTAHFAVPRFYELLMPYLRSDAELRRTFFSELKLLFYAAAGLGQRFWDELREVSIEACGEELLIMTGLGSTETAPFAICTGLDGASAGMIGLPAPGMQLKLAPVGDKLEGRVRGPNITPGYYKDDELTKAAFDEEGYYKLGDGMRFVDEAHPKRGLIFDGRLAEDFKLSTGTWVSVGPLRSKIMAAAGGLVQDVVIGAPDRDYVTALLFPNVHLCREAAGAAADTPIADVLDHPGVRDRLQTALRQLAAASTGSSTFVARAMLMAEPPSVEAREITDKGSLNQKAVLVHRAALVDELYAASPSARVLSAK
jgi:feruloyl-CoA synthase